MIKLLVVFAMLLVGALAAPSELNFVAAAAPAAYISTPLLKSTAIVAEPTHVQVHESTLAKVADVVESIPTAISHQSSTVVHSRAQRITPIIAPAVRSYTAPAVRTYAAAPEYVQHAVAPAAAYLQHAEVPQLSSFSLLRSLPVGLGPAAAFVHAHAPLQLRSYAGYNTFAAAPSAYTYGTPLVYARAIKK